MIAGQCKPVSSRVINANAFMNTKQHGIHVFYYHSHVVFIYTPAYITPYTTRNSINPIIAGFKWSSPAPDTD